MDQGLWRCASANAGIGLGLLLTCVGLSIALAGLLGISAPFASALIGGGAALISSGGLLIGLGTFARTAEDTQSRFYLEQAIRGIEAAHDYLADGNNERSKWILAARMLARSRQLIAGISNQAHKTVFELVQDEHRIRFHKILKADEANTASFFMGSPEATEPLDAAVRRQGEDFDLKYIDEHVLLEVYKFASYPENYGDALERRPFDETEMFRLRMTFPSLHHYVKYRRRVGLIPSRARVYSHDIDTAD